MVKNAIDGFFKKKLLLEWNAFATPFYHSNGWWARCSAQVWNDVSVFFTDAGSGNWMKLAPQMSDFEYLGRAYKDLAAQVVEQIIDEKGELREGYTA